MKIVILLCFAGTLSFQAITLAQAQGGGRFIANLERALKDKEPEWDVNKIVLPPGIPPEKLGNGSPLLSPRGAMHFYQLKSKQWAGSISIFYGDSQRDAANHFAWSLRNWSKNGDSLREPIGDQTVQMVSNGIAEVMSRKANICVNLRISLVNLQKGDKSSGIEARTANALAIAYKFTKHVIDQAPTN